VGKRGGKRIVRWNDASGRRAFCVDEGPRTPLLSFGTIQVLFELVPYSFLKRVVHNYSQTPLPPLLKRDSDFSTKRVVHLLCKRVVSNFGKVVAKFAYLTSSSSHDIS
jgi:hypothetical protein